MLSEVLTTKLATHGIDGFLVTNPVNIKYICGFSGSSAMILFSRSKRHLLVDSRYYDEAKQAKTELMTGFDIVPIQGGRTLYNLILSGGIKRLGFEPMHMTFHQYDFMVSNYRDIEMVSILNFVESFRAVKSSDAIEAVRKSAEIAESTFLEILNFVKIGMTERDVKEEVERVMRYKGAENTAFKTIIVSGSRSALPHGLPSDKIIGDGDFLTLDYGCIYNGYCSDITRTIVMGKSSEKQRHLYNLISDAQQAAIDAVKPQTLAKHVDEAARKIIKLSGYGPYFKHGLGHGVGFEVHELPRLTEDSPDVLQSGMVLAIEPGVYIEKFGGVRVEDMIIVTEDGYERLTKAPEHLIEI